MPRDVVQMIDNPGDLVRRSHDGLLWSKPRPHRAKIRTKGRIGPGNRLGGLAKGLGGAVDHFQRPGAQHTATEMSLCGASPSHEQKCFTVGNVLISVPTSARMVWAMDAEMPVTATRSTPVRRARYVRAL